MTFINSILEWPEATAPTPNLILSPQSHLTQDGKVIVHGDGSLKYGTHPIWRAAACAIYYNDESPLNLAFRLPGQNQSIYAAELAW
eukprot:4212694-Karenia_brevis.AAC.1